VLLMDDPDVTYTVAYFVEEDRRVHIRVDLGPDEGETEAIAFRDELYPGSRLFKQELWHKFTEVV
jgi:hypothetical protein